ncbi:MAG: hypothetical protein IT437_09250 [Phycisphaerales bacterium]|nr:hypothetical protein [Phycisphaerales bacterium]
MTFIARMGSGLLVLSAIAKVMSLAPMLRWLGEWMSPRSAAGVLAAVVMIELAVGGVGLFLPQRVALPALVLFAIFACVHVGFMIFENPGCPCFGAISNSFSTLAEYWMTASCIALSLVNACLVHHPPQRRIA